MSDIELTKWALGLFAFFFGQWVLWISGRTLKARKNINDAFEKIRGGEGSNNEHGHNRNDNNRIFLVIEVRHREICEPACDNCDESIEQEYKESA